MHNTKRCCDTFQTCHYFSPSKSKQFMYRLSHLFWPFFRKSTNRNYVLFICIVTTEAKKQIIRHSPHNLKTHYTKPTKTLIKNDVPSFSQNFGSLFVFLVIKPGFHPFSLPSSRHQNCFTFSTCFSFSSRLISHATATLTTRLKEINV